MVTNINYLKALKSMYDASEDTLNEKLNSLNISDLEAAANSEFVLKIIDPPIINGIDLREHPNLQQRKFYTNIFDSGGFMSGVYDMDDNLQFIVPKTITGENIKDSKDLYGIKNKVKEQKTIRKIKKLIDDDFENPYGRHGKPRPKEMTPADFWILVPAKTKEILFNAEEQEVIDFVAYINAQSVVDLKDKTVRDGIKWLRKNGYIKRLFQEIED